MAISKVQRGSGARYRVRIRKKGHPQRIKTFRRRSDAERWERKTLQAIEEGRDFPEAKAQRLRLSKLARHYLDGGRDKDSGKSIEAAELSEGARRKRRRHLEAWIAILNDPTLSEITPDAIYNGREALAGGATASGRPAADATVNRYVATLRHCLNYGRKRSYLSVNPAAGITARKESGRFEDTEEELITEAGYLALIESCRESREPLLAPLVELAAWTGGRQGELLRLRWPDVDLKKRTATVHRSKSGDKRALPLSPPAMASISELHKLRRPGRDLLFARERDGKPVFPRKAWETARKAAGLDGLRFHDLRHLAATRYAMAGGTLAELADLQGHKTLAMVQRYKHITDGHLVEVADRMAAKFSL